MNTVDPPPSVITKIEEQNVRDFVSSDNCIVPIAIFTTEDDGKDRMKRVGSRFIVFSSTDSGGTTAYVFSQNEDSIHVSSVSSLSYQILRLSGLTSPETPMTIVNSGGFIYIVIGNTAYLLSEWGADIAPNALGELYWSEAPVGVSEIKFDF